MIANSKQNFADWYASADILLTAETQTQRLSAIENLKKNKNKAFWLDIVRIYLGIPVASEDNYELFIKAFKEADPVYPLTGNQNLNKTLAAILLCFRLEVDSYMNTAISLAVINFGFLGNYPKTISAPVLEFSKIYLEEEALRERNVNLDTHQNNQDELESRMEEAEYVLEAEDHHITNYSVNALLQANKSLMEETNILWWLFGETGIIDDGFFRNIGLQKFTLLSAFDLFELITFTTAPIRTKNILSKAIFLSNSAKYPSKKLSPYQIIKEIDHQEVESLIKAKRLEAHFVPLLTALSKSLQYETNMDWSGMYNANLGYAGDIKEAVNPIDISFQLLNELLLMKNLS